VHNAVEFGAVKRLGDERAGDEGYSAYAG
jgi:hypothetical protein